MAQEAGEIVFAGSLQKKKGRIGYEKKYTSRSHLVVGGCPADRIIDFPGSQQKKVPV
jgi:hypothetical protein